MSLPLPPPNGERTWRDAMGGVVIQSWVGKPGGRRGYEKQFFRGVEVGLSGWERAHSQGNITGHESALGIRYAPQDVNQAFQRLGIERFIAELYDEIGPDRALLLTTATYSHPGTIRLKEIQYRIDVVRNGMARALFEASIEIENKRVFPRVSIHVELRTSREAWGALLR